MVLSLRLPLLPNRFFILQLFLLVWSQNVYSASTSIPLLSNATITNQTQFSTFVDELAKAGFLAPTKQEVIVPLLVDGRSLGEVHAIIADDPALSNLGIDILIELLEPFVSAGLIHKLKEQLVLSSRLDFAQLNDFGVHLSFDDDKILLRAELAPMIRKPLRHNLQTHPLQQEEDPSIIPNASFSGGLDYFISGSWLNSERQALNLELDGHLNLFGVVLQNRLSYVEQQDSRWQRRQTLLTRDWSNQLTRLSVGDLNYPRIGLMSNPQLSGISFGTFFDLKPLQVNYPLSGEDFFLEKDSRIEVIIDGQLSGRHNLLAGQHNIYDMPLIDGINQVELRITDILGRQQILRFFETQDQRLLTPGLSNYSVTLGIPRSSGLDGITYQDSNQMISGFYRYGWSEDLTIGGWLEIDNNMKGIGITGITSQVFGAFTGELALSHYNGEQSDVAPAVRLGYRYRTRRWTLDSEWSWQHKLFSTLSQTATDNNTHHQARVGLTLPHLGPWTANLSLTHSRRWQGNSNFSKRLTISRQFSQDWRLSLNFAHFNAYSDQESFIGMQFYWSPSGSRHQANASYNSTKNSANTEYNYRRNGELGMDFRAGLRDNDSGHQQRVDINHLSSQVDSRLTLNRETSITGDIKQSRSFSLGAAVAFADGHWATGRPLRGQPFAVFNSEASLAQAKIGIVRGAGQHPTAFLVGAEDTAIMSNLSAYYINQLNIDLQDLPMEIQIQKEQFRVKPGYRGAVVISVGVEGIAYVTATLEYPTGRPLVHKVAYIHSLSGDAPIMVFTDDKGFTVVEGISSGDYQIRIPGVIGLMGTFNVPKGLQGELSLGVLILEEEIK